MVLTHPLILSGGCEPEDLRAARKLTYPRDMLFQAVLINEDSEWNVTLWEGDEMAPSGRELKPGEWRTESLKLHFDQPFEIRRLTFSAKAHGRTQASEVLQVRPADPSRIGVVFSRTPENVPDIFWLTNPESVTNRKRSSP